MQSAFILFTTVDLFQTNWIAHNRYTYERQDNYIIRHENYEDNKFSAFFIGKYPTSKKIYFWIPAGMIVHTGIAYFLPKPFRNIWQFIFISIEFITVNDNYQAGCKIQF